MFLRTLFLLLIYFNGAELHPTSCAEDSQCSSGFYCEESAHYCRECLRCDELKRESPVPRELCVKSVVQCGQCFKGLALGVLGSNNKIEDCGSASGDAGAPAYLPTYAWAAIAVGLLLMIVMLGVFLKTKTFKVVAYSSRTSVQSLRAPNSPPTEPPPPPYNYHLPAAPSFPSGTFAAGASEMQTLVGNESPKLFTKGGEPARREAASSQTARVCAQPEYARLPQDLARCNSPEPTMASPQDEATVLVVTNAPDATALLPPELSNRKTRISALPGNVTENTEEVPLQLSRRELKNEDSNNNRPSPERPSSPETSGDAWYPANVISGPSFVINVVENINNLHQRNQANFCRSPS